MFHNTDDEARINMPPRSTNHLPFNTHDFEEMVWENNTLVMQQQQKKRRAPAGCSSGFSDFFLLDNITENVNPRAVPDETDSLYGLPAANTINYHFSKNHNNKRSREEPTIQAVEENKKLKATINTPPPQGGDDSLVPGDKPIAAASTDIIIKRKKTMINESNKDHLVPGPDMSIAASNDIVAPPPPCCTNTHTSYQHSDSSASSSSYLPETQQWSDEDDESARRSRRRRNRSSLIHTRSEKKRRDRINKKMRALQVLLPNTNKVVDKASVLDEAIQYVKSLQLQLQLLSTPMMMPQFPMNQFSPAMGLGMAPHQFPMHGFPQMSCFPYMPFFGGPVVQAETTSVDQIGSNPPPMSGSNHSSYPNDFSQMGFESELQKK